MSFDKNGKSENLIFYSDFSRNKFDFMEQFLLSFLNLILFRINLEKFILCLSILEYRSTSG